MAGVYPCKGGGPNDYAFINLSRDLSQRSPTQWEGLLKTIEREDLLSDERLADRGYRAKHRDEIVAIITGWTKQHDKHAVMRRMARKGVKGISGGYPQSPAPSAKGRLRGFAPLDSPFSAAC